MAVLQFPADPGGSDPLSYSENGITYDWTGSYWKARVDNVGVEQIIAGANVTISPAAGTGEVTINSTGGGGGGAEVHVGNTPPGGETVGDLWFNSDDGRLYVYYTDPDGDSFWVDASPAAENGGDGSGSVGSLQEVTDVGNETTNYIRVGDFDSSSTTSSGSVVDLGTLWAQRPYSPTMGCLNIWGGDTETAIIYSDGGASFGEGNIILKADGSADFGGLITAKGDGASQDGALKLNCSQNSHGVTIQSPPHSANASYTLTLPDDTGTDGQVLSTDGNGELSWVGFPAAPALDLQAVTDNGNTTTNGVTLGSGNISLNADGNAEFAGRIDSGTFNVAASKGRVQTFCGTDTTPADWQAFVGFYGGEARSLIKADGTLILSDTNALTTPNITINANGNVDIANEGDYNTNGGVSLGRLGIINIFRDTSTADAEIFTIDSNVGGSKSRKITFEADGSADFVGQVTSGDTTGGENTSGANIGPDGYVSILHSSRETANCFSIYDTADGSFACEIKGDGSADFAGGYVKHYATGAGLYRGSLTISTGNNFNTSNATGSSGARAHSNGYFISQRDGSEATPSANYLFAGYNGNIEVASIKQDGSASFAGRADIGTNSLSDYAAIFANNSDTQATIVATNAGDAESFLSQANSDQIAIQVNDIEVNTAGTVVIKGDGSASFAGTVNSSENTIVTGTAPDFTKGNFWVCEGGFTIFSPDTVSDHASGLIRLTAAPTGWGSNYKFPNGVAPTISTFPAIVPYYVQDIDNILCGTPVEGVS